eukprot:Gb_03123 [translate_table: standard]
MRSDHIEATDEDLRSLENSVGNLEESGDILKPGISSVTENRAQFINYRAFESMEREIMATHHPSQSASQVLNQSQGLTIEQGQDIKHLLVACAEAIVESEPTMAEKLIAELKQEVSVFGDPMQRLGAYMVEALVARLGSSGWRIYKGLKCKELSRLSSIHIFHEACPPFKFGYVAANGAIAEALKGKSRVHIIDFGIGRGSQWISLIQALAETRGNSPPHIIRITGVDDPSSDYARGGGMEISTVVCQIQPGFVLLLGYF